MSTPVHYDVEAAVKGFLALSEARYGNVKNLPERARVQLRHRDIAAGFLRLSLEEANRGTHPNDSMGGAIDIIAEFVINFVQAWDREEQGDIAGSFSTSSPRPCSWL